MKKKKEIKDMTDDELQTYGHKILKRNRVVAKLCLGLFATTFASIVFMIVSHSALSSKQKEFLTSHGYNFDAYKEKIVSEEVEQLQTRVLNGELSFEDYETQKQQIAEPTYDEFKQTWSEGDVEDFNKLEDPVGHSIGAFALSSVALVACGRAADVGRDKVVEVNNEIKSRNKKKHNKEFSDEYFNQFHTEKEKEC